MPKEEINLSNNNFAGPFPQFLGNLEYLGEPLLPVIVFLWLWLLNILVSYAA
jgi:hypothetical protein